MGVYRTQPTRTRIARWLDRWADVLLVAAAAIAVALITAYTVISLGYPVAQP